MKGLGRAFAICVAALTIGAASPLVARAAPQTDAASSVATGEQPPPQVRELLQLLSDPQVGAWLAAHRDAKATAPQSAGVGASSFAEFAASRVDAAHAQVAALSGALPELPGEFGRAWSLFRSDMASRGNPRVLLLLLMFVGLGFGAEWGFQRATRRLRQYLDERPVETVKDRLPIVAGRSALSAGVVTAFALGSIGAFLAFSWPPLLREIVLGYLLAVLVIRIGAVVARLLLAPRSELYRIVPMNMAAARFWQRRITLFVGWFAIGYVTIGLLHTLGFSLPGRQLVAYALGLGLLVIALEATWRRPSRHADPATPRSAAARRFGEAGRNALLSAAFVLLWGLWVVRAMPAFWLILMVIVVPLACGVTARAAEHLLRPTEADEQSDDAPSVTAVFLERGIRALLIIGAIGVLAWSWGIDFALLAAKDTLMTRLLHGMLSAVVIALIADVVWHAAKAAINRALADAADPGQPNTPEARRRARLRTLLPIVRNVLFVVVATVAALMMLAALGIEIGPLIAGAGVVGVAIGFGAQAFVRDVIAGMFYLIDDAFRVGEYIQSGNYKGTVESFSIRSVRLRHHRGPVYTVPFSLLGAVQNMSRDWVIDKLTIGITYDSDPELARKLIKQIGLELRQIPEFAPLIIEPLKMQGVEQFGDCAVQIRLKMVTLPGEQFVIRRKAYAMIKKAFDANGIKFALPTVQLAGDADASRSAAAVAEHALGLAEARSVA